MDSFDPEMVSSMDTSPEFLAEDMGPSIIATATFMIFLCTTFVILRYYSRYLTNTAFSIEDVIIPFAWIAEMGLCIVSIAMVEKAGTGRHMSYILSTDPPMVVQHFKGVMIQEVLHPAAVAFPKLTVVLLYLRILTNKYERIAAKILVFLIFATWLSFSVAVMFQCMPISFNWDKSLSGKCFNVEVFANSSSVPNIVTDLAVLILPLRTLWNLKISIARRVGLLLIFLTGSVGIIASIIRTIVFAKTLADTDPLADVTWNHVSLVDWTMIEPGMYLLSACALSFKPLFRACAKVLHLERFLTNTKSTFAGNKSYPIKKPTVWTDTKTVFELGHVGNGEGTFYRLSEDSGSLDWSRHGSKRGSRDVKPCMKMEVLVTKTISLNSEERTDDADSFARNDFGGKL